MLATRARRIRSTASTHLGRWQNPAIWYRANAVRRLGVGDRRSGRCCARFGSAPVELAFGPYGVALFIGPLLIALVASFVALGRMRSTALARASTARHSRFVDGEPRQESLFAAHRSCLVGCDRTPCRRRTAERECAGGISASGCHGPAHRALEGCATALSVGVRRIVSAVAIVRRWNRTRTGWSESSSWRLPAASSHSSSASGSPIRLPRERWMRAAHAGAIRAAERRRLEAD